MKIGTILTATDNNPLYSEFIPIFIKAWKKVLPEADIKIYYIDNSIPDNLKDYTQYLELFKPIDNIKTGFIAQNIRILAPRFIKRNEGVIITDMDMIPLNRKYYIDNIKDSDSSSFVVYRDLNLLNELPICYNISLPSTWKEIFGDKSNEDILREWYLTIQYNGAHGKEGWSTDQNKLNNYISKWNGNKIYLTDEKTGFKRLDRGYDDISINDSLRQKIANGEYSDYHMLRPYHSNKEINDFIVDSMPQYSEGGRKKKRTKNTKKNRNKKKYSKKIKKGGVVNKTAIILTTNDNYIDKTFNTISDLRTNGKYNDDVVLFYNEELSNINKLNEIKDKFNVILKQFPKIDTSSVEKSINSMNNSLKFKQLRNKMFQYHKFYAFDKYFKQWDKIFYIDAGMHIYSDIHRFLNIDTNNNILADNLADDNNNFTLESQFNTISNIGKELQKNYNLTSKDFFQSGVLLFNSSIIEDNTVQNLIDLMNKYPIGWGDQAIMNIYFKLIKNIWKPLPRKDSFGLLFNIKLQPNTKPTDYVMVKVL